MSSYYPYYYNTQPQKVVVVNQNTYVTTILSILLSLVILFVIKFLVSMLYDRFIQSKSDPIEIWYAKYGPQYKSIFDIQDVYRYMNDSRWEYELKSWIFDTKSMSDLPMNQLYDFVSTYVYPHLYRKVQGKTYNDGRHFILPRHMVESIQITNLDNDGDYETWLQDRNDRVKSDPATSKFETFYNNTKWGSTPLEWRNRIAFWCGCKTAAQISSFWHVDSGDGKGQGADKYIVAVGVQGLPKDNNRISEEIANQNWFGTLSDGKTLINPDNIFARYGISYKAAGLYYLGNDDISGTSDGEFNTRLSMLTLLGLDEIGKPLPEKVLGGWVGYFKYFGSNPPGGLGPLERLFSREDTAGAATNPYITPCSKPKSAPDVGGIIGSIFGGLTGAAMAVAGAPAVGPAVILAAIFSIGGGAASAIFDFTKKKPC